MKVTSDRIRVAVVADTRVCADALARCLDQDRSIVVLAMGMWPEYLDELHRHEVDIVLLHLRREEGIRAARQIRRRLGAKIVALGVPETERDIISYAEAGISTYLARDSSLDRLPSVVRAAAQGEVVPPPPRIVGALLERVATLSEISRGVAKLTPRERQILHLVSDGLTNKEIATQLCIEISTVKNHMHRVLKKLEVSSRSEAVAAFMSAEGGPTQERRPTAA
jgi:RNA polymerase sigma factor (sigma-70 family)